MVSYSVRSGTQNRATSASSDNCGSHSAASQSSPGSRTNGCFIFSSRSAASHIPEAAVRPSIRATRGLRLPDALLVEANRPRRLEEQTPGLFGQRYALRQPFAPGPLFGFARDQGLRIRRSGFRSFHVGDITNHLFGKQAVRIDASRIDIQGKHSVGEAPFRRGASVAGECSAEDFAHQRQPRSLVSAKGAQRTESLADIPPLARLVFAIKQPRIIAGVSIRTDQRVGGKRSPTLACH